MNIDRSYKEPPGYNLPEYKANTKCLQTSINSGLLFMILQYILQKYVYVLLQKNMGVLLDSGGTREAIIGGK